VRRREFITLLGSAAAWPLAARAQQLAMPVIGFLNPQSPETYAGPMRALRQGLKDAGYVEGENVAIEYRWADNQYDRLPALAAELVRRRVAVIVATGGPLPAQAAKAATTSIPIIFNVADDPVRHGLVANLARPGGNLTGNNLLTIELAAKRVELIRVLVPGLARIAVLVNPTTDENTRVTLQDVQAAAGNLGLQIQVHNADTPARSMPRFNAWDANGRMRCLSPLPRFSSPDASSSLSWRHSTGFRRRMGCAILQRLAGL
jgi:putative ABC transport system substrate-binding protein